VKRPNPDKPPAPFAWGKAATGTLVMSVGGAATAAGSAAYTSGDSATVAVVAGIAFIGTAAFGFLGEYVKHRADDPSPVFDGPTTLLFDLTGYIICLLLFYIPALGVDHAVRPAAALPGLFGFAALFLTALLLPVLRGLLINLGLVSSERESDLSQ
jgi:hypothetical protein